MNDGKRWERTVPHRPSGRPRGERFALGTSRNSIGAMRAIPPLTEGVLRGEGLAAGSLDFGVNGEPEMAGPPRSIPLGERLSPDSRYTVRGRE